MGDMGSNTLLMNCSTIWKMTEINTTTLTDLLTLNFLILYSALKQCGLQQSGWHRASIITCVCFLVFVFCFLLCIKPVLICLSNCLFLGCLYVQLLQVGI